MVTCLKVKKEHAESARQFLKEKGWLDKQHIIGSTPDRYVILPLTGNFQKNLPNKFPGSKFETKNLPKFPERPGDLKQMLKNILSEKEIEKIVKSYDVVGDIAILEIPNSLEKHELAIGHAIKRVFPNIKVVARKAGKRQPINRILPLKIITGEKRLITMHKEHGVFMKVDLGNVYFSTRASSERLRIAKLAKKGEKVLVMFGGIAPYALVIAKSQPDCKIWSVELNPDAHELAEENVRINRFGYIITLILGDVRDILPMLGEKFDRLVMPFPEKNWEYFDLALMHAGKNCIIHFLVFVSKGKIDKAKEKIRQLARKAGRQIKIINYRLFGSYAPHINRYTFDILVR